MRHPKITLLKIVIALLIFTFIPVTGCSKFEDFKENLASRAAQRKEDDKRNFSTMHEFEDYYSKEIKNALKNKKKSALKELFCDAVLENTYDMDEGLKYVFSLEDWSDFSFSKGNSSPIISSPDFNATGLALDAALFSLTFENFLPS